MKQKIKALWVVLAVAALAVFLIKGGKDFVLGLDLAGGFLPRVAALSIWYIQTALYNRNVLTDDPSMAFLGLLLLMLALIPSQPKFGKRLEQIQIPYFVFMYHFLFSASRLRSVV